MARAYRMNPGTMGKVVINTTPPEEPKPKTRKKKKQEEPGTVPPDSESLNLEVS